MRRINKCGIALVVAGLASASAVSLAPMAAAATAKAAGVHSTANIVSMAGYCLNVAPDYCSTNDGALLPAVSGKVNLVQPRGTFVNVNIDVQGLVPGGVYTVFADTDGGCWESGYPDALALGTFTAAPADSTTAAPGSGSFTYQAASPDAVDGWAFNLNLNHDLTQAAAGTCYSSETAPSADLPLL